MKIDGYTRMAAVMARPIKHSISPFIHNYAFEQTGINGVYVAWDIAEEDVGPSLENIKRYDMFGVNVSMPYKQTVMPYMDELTESAQLIGAVNTVINRDGRLIGHNTDGIGFFRSLATLANFDVKGKVMMIFGGGGAATAIIAQAALNGAKKIIIFNRAGSIDKVKERANDLSKQTGVLIEVQALENQDLVQECILTSDLLVNATSVGMDGESMLISTDTVLPKTLLVVDAIYQPFETPFLAYAKQQGVKTLNGLGMLLFQAAEAYEKWTGVDMPTQDIWQALEKRYNIE